jgi:hypothetical protein
MTNAMTNAMNDNRDIILAIREAVDARRGSLRDLRRRITALLDPMPVGAVLRDEQGEVCRIIRVCTGTSQWANRDWDVTITGKGALTLDGRLLCDDLPSSYWDGTNTHYRGSEPTCRYDEEEYEPGAALQYESGARTRELAARLPAAIDRYIAWCRREAGANQECAARIAS